MPLRKWAAIRISICSLRSILGLQNRLDEDSVSHRGHSPELPALAVTTGATRSAFDMDYEIDGFPNLSFGIGNVFWAWLRMTRFAKRWSAFSAEFAWIVASDPAWPVLNESSSVRASVPRTSPR